METRKEIVISGYYGSGNLGDEAILEGLIDSLTERFDQDRIKVVVLSDNPDETRKTHKVQAVDRWNPLEVIQAMHRCDLLISGGGGLLQDRTSSTSLWYYLGVIWLALITRTPVYILGQGIGPLNHTVNKLLVKWTVRHVKGSLVRDSSSQQMLENMVSNKSKVIQGTDLGFLLPKKNLEPNSFFNDQSPPIVAAALRNDISGKMDVVRAVSSGLDLLNQKHHINVVLFSTNPFSDKPIHHELCNATDARCNIIEVPHLRPSELVEMMKGIDLVIGGRLHVIVFSLLSETPVQGISYDPKMDHLINNVNEITGKATIPLWHPEELINARDYLTDLETTYETREDQKESLIQAKVRLEQEAQSNLEKALDWLDSELNNE